MKLLILVLTLSILFCGCTDTQPDATVPTTVATQPAETMQPTVSASLNQPEETTLPQETEVLGWAEGSVEAQTNGALLSWQLPGSRIQGICFMGQDLLAFYNNGFTTELRLISLEDMSVKATAKLKGNVPYHEQSWQVTDDGIVYYSQSKKAVIILDTQLNEVRSVQICKDAKEQAVISRDLKMAYYSDGWSLFSVDLESGESAALADTGGYIHGLQTLFDDTVLMYRDPWGKVVFLSTQTGQVIGRDALFDGIATEGNRYFLARVSDDYQEYLYGSFGAEQGALIPNRRLSYQNYLPGRHAVVFRENGGGFVPFDYYDLTTGKRIASMEPCFDDAMWFSKVIEDPTEDYLWFVTMNNDYENVKLYRWEYGAMPTDDAQVYIGKRWTEAAPDWEGIARCRARADALGETYGVEILIYNQARVPWGYSVKYLYQVDIIEDSLDSLETALASYPEGFFETLGKASQNGKIQISLARRIVTDSDWRYYDCMQYWNNGNACIVVQSGQMTGRLVNRGIGFLLEEFLGDAGYLESWVECNPENFEYFGSYEEVLDGPIRYDYLGYYFIDSTSMISRHYDVAEIFEYAMMNVSGDYFKGEGLKNKLELLSQSIREAFDLTETEETFPWEKHLPTTQ